MTGDAESVLHLPDYTDSNPYQRELISGLNQAGVSVRLSSASPWFPVIRGYLRAERPPAVHLHWITPFVGTDRWWLSAVLGLRLLLELIIVRLDGASLIWTIHNTTAHESRTPRVDLAVRLGVARIVHRYIVHCERAKPHVIATLRLRRSEQDRLHAIPHGHYGGVYPPAPPRGRVRSALGVGPEEHLFLFFGLIRPYKNVEGLIHAFKQLDDEQVRLCIAGNPWSEDTRRAVTAASDDDDRIVTDLRFVPDEELPGYFAAADVVVMPFESILTSGSVVLAMSYGCPVVVPDSGCPGSLIGHDGGIAYDSADPQGLAKALESVLTDEHDLEAIGTRNRRLVEQFDWHRIGEATAAVYDGQTPPIDWQSPESVVPTQ